MLQAHVVGRRVVVGREIPVRGVEFVQRVAAGQNICSSASDHVRRGGVLGRDGVIASLAICAVAVVAELEDDGVVTVPAIDGAARKDRVVAVIAINECRRQ